MSFEISLDLEVGFDGDSSEDLEQLLLPLNRDAVGQHRDRWVRLDLTGSRS